MSEVIEISIEDAITRLDSETQADYDRAEAAGDVEAAVKARLQQQVNEAVKEMLRNGQCDVCVVDGELSFYRKSDEWVLNDILAGGRLERDSDREE